MKTDRTRCNTTIGLCCAGGHGPIYTRSSPEDCCSHCRATEECTLWTFNNSTGNAKCFLKLLDSRASCPHTDPEKDAYCTSGTVGRPPITPGPGPSPPPPPGPPDPETGNAFVLYDLDADPYERTDVSAANPDGNSHAMS